MSSRNSSLLATIIVVTIIGTLLLAVMPSLGDVPAPTNASEVWVDPAFTESDAGGHSFGTDAFNTVSDGVYNVNAGGIVHVAPATYPENVTITKPLTLLGNYADVSGSSDTRDASSESIVGLGYEPVATADDEPGIYIQSDDVVINGVAVVGGYGVMTPMDEAYKNLVIKDVYMDNTYEGIVLNTTNSQVKDNYMNSMGAFGILSQGDNVAIDGNVVNSSGLLIGIYSMGNYGAITNNLVNTTYVLGGIAYLGDNGQVTGNTVNTTVIELLGIAYGGNDGQVSNNLINQSGMSGEASGFVLMGSNNKLTNNKVEAFALFNIINCGSGFGPTAQVSDYSGTINNLIANNIVNSTLCVYAVGIEGDSNTLSNNVFNIPFVDSTAVEYYGNHANVASNTFNFTTIDTMVPMSAQFSASSASIPEQLQAFQMNAPMTASSGNSIIYVSGSYATVADNTVLNPTDYMAGSASVASVDAYYGIDVEGEFAAVDGNYLENVYNGIEVDGYKTTVTYNTVNNSEFYGGYGDNIYVYGDDSKVIGNTLLNNEYYWADDAIYMDEVSGVTISDNNITNADYGIYIYGGDTTIGSNYVVENNTFTTYGDYYDSEGIYGEYINNALIKGNTIKAVDGFSSDGIELYDCSNVQVVDNYVENSDNSLYIDTCPGTSNLIDNNTMVLTYDESAEYGIYLEYVGSATVSNNNLTAEAGYWDIGIRARESGLLTIKDNTIVNSDDGIYIYSGCGPLYNTSVEGNTVANTMEQNSNNAIYVDFADRTSIKDNVISSGNGTWDYGIELYESYSGLIDGNSISNANNGIIYDYQYYGGYAVYTSAVGTQPASDWATVQNNNIDLTNAGEGSIGIQYYGQTGYIDYNTIIGSASSIAGIAGIVDNVSIIGNTVSGINQTSSEIPTIESEVTSGALVLSSLNEGSSVGNVYLASNVLSNNSVQMIIQDMTVFDLNNANTVVTLNNTTLSQVISSNTLDKAYWIVDVNGDLKMLDLGYFGGYIDPYMSNSIVVYGDRGMADSYADVEAGDKVVESTMNTYTYNLVPGWNLISVPLNVPNSDLDSFFPADVKSDITEMWGWDESAQNWEFYGPDSNDWFYTQYPALTGVETGRAYWVNMTKEASFVIEGTAPSVAPESSVALVDGWNFVGTTGLYPSTPQELYASSPEVWGWDESAQNWEFYGSDSNDWFYTQYPALAALQPGHGHWVKVVTV